MAPQITRCPLPGWQPVELGHLTRTLSTVSKSTRDKPREESISGVNYASSLNVLHKHLPMQASWWPREAGVFIPCKSPNSLWAQTASQMWALITPNGSKFQFSFTVSVISGYVSSPVKKNKKKKGGGGEEDRRGGRRGGGGKADPLRRSRRINEKCTRNAGPGNSEPP